MSVENILAQLMIERAKINAAIKALSTIASTKSVPDAPAGAGKRKRRKLSAEARKRIADAQRKRWAAQEAKNK